MKISNENRKKILENYKFWESVYLSIDTTLKKYLRKEEVVDFDIFLSDEYPNIIFVSVLYNSSKDYTVLRLSEMHDFNHTLEITFKRNDEWTR